MSIGRKINWDTSWILIHKDSESFELSTATESNMLR
jgi:hypothetical protein